MTTTINASTTSGLVQTADTSGSLQLQTANTAALTIDASQNVGIGTTSPYGKMNIAGGRAFFGGNNEQYSIGVGYNQSRVNTGAQVYYIGATDSATPSLVFSEAGGTERMRIDSSGKVFVGKTSVAFGTAGVEIYPAGEIDLTASAQATLYLNRLTSDGNIIIFHRQGTPVGSVSVTGSATSYVTSSDYRLKENIAPMTGALETVAKLNPVTYRWKADGSDGQGFIAHELQAIVPDCVTGEKDAVDKEGNPVYQGIDTSFLVATLTKAIQELSAKVDAQQQEINALKGAK